MREEPKLFKVLSLLFFTFGLGYGLWNFDGQNFVMNIEPDLMDVLLSFSFISLAVSLYKCSTYTQYFFYGNVALVITNFVSSVSEESYFNSITPVVVSFFYYSLYLVFTQSEEYKVLTNTNKQWWKTAPRIPAKVSSVLYLGKDKVQLETVDISESGVLLKMTNPAAFRKYHQFLGKNVTIELNLKDSNVHLSNAELVRMNFENRGKQGIALTFTKKTEEFSKSLSEFLTHTQDMIKNEKDILSKNIESYLC